MAAIALDRRPTQTTDDQTQATLRVNAGPTPFRGTARAVGVLFLAGMFAYGGGNGFLQSILSAPDHLSAVGAGAMTVAICAVLMMLASVWDAAHGILMFPVLKQHGERLAIGYLGYRIVDAVFLAVGIVFLLLQIPLASAYLNASASDAFFIQTLSTLSIKASLYAYEFGMIFVGLAGVLLCYTFLKAKLVPTPIAVWGLAGYAIHLGGAVLQVLGFDLRLIHVIPGGLWELFIGGWLIAKGFSAPTVPSERSTSSTSRTSPAVAIVPSPRAVGAAA
jgi:hypothetical protein